MASFSVAESLLAYLRSLGFTVSVQGEHYRLALTPDPHRPPLPADALADIQARVRLYARELAWLVLTPAQRAAAPEAWRLAAALDAWDGPERLADGTFARPELLHEPYAFITVDPRTGTHAVSQDALDAIAELNRDAHERWAKKHVMRRGTQPVSRMKGQTGVVT
jgi:hypothetical protein